MSVNGVENPGIAVAAAVMRHRRWLPRFGVRWPFGHGLEKDGADAADDALRMGEMPTTIEGQEAVDPMAERGRGWIPVSNAAART